jgi:hypothetical protein
VLTTIELEDNDVFGMLVILWARDATPDQAGKARGLGADAFEPLLEHASQPDFTP